MLTHRNLVANILADDRAGHLQRRRGHDGRVPAVLSHLRPHDHRAASGLWAGATLVVVPKFELEPYFDLVERHRATVLHVVPPIVARDREASSGRGPELLVDSQAVLGAAPSATTSPSSAHGESAASLQQGYGIDRGGARLRTSRRRT